MRLSIELSPEQHQRLKAAAALKGKTIKQYVLERTLPAGDEASALAELESYLEPRVRAAKAGELSEKSVDDVFNTVKQETNDGL